MIAITITCDTDGCDEEERITPEEIRTVMDHPDASPRRGELATAWWIAVTAGWYDTLSTPTRRMCPTHSGRRRRPRKLTPYP